MSEVIGQHTHNTETEVYKYGLPQQYKDAIDELLLMNNKFKPSHLVFCLEKKFEKNLSKKESGQVSSYISIATVASFASNTKKIPFLELEASFKVIFIKKT